MRYTILLTIFIFCLFSCNKDKFQTVPSLKYKSVNTNVLNRDEILVFTLSFTDAEGDLTDSIIVKKSVPGCSRGDFFDEYPIPAFPSEKNQKGDITVNFSYNDLNPQCLKNDTATFRFVLKDKAQNKSDTAVSEPIVIIY